MVKSFCTSSKLGKGPRRHGQASSFLTAGLRERKDIFGPTKLCLPSQAMAEIGGAVEPKTVEEGTVTSRTGEEEWKCD